MSDKGQSLLNISEANNSWNKEALRLSREIRSVSKSETPSDSDVSQDEGSTPAQNSNTTHKNP
jgi:hypothetical protein